MRTTSVEVIRIPTRSPADVSGLVAMIESKRIDPATIIAILGKTEGNGGVNDFTRELAVMALCAVLAPYLKVTPQQVEEKIALVMSGGTEGVLSPHLTIFTRMAATGGGEITGKRLSIGIAQTRDFRPEEIGRAAQIEETAQAVRAAMADSGIDDPKDVHFVQIKCPLLTSERMEEAVGRGQKPVTGSPYGSMGYSRGASALGIARGLGEIPGRVREEDVLKDWALYSGVASTSAGIELMHNVIILMGNSPTSSSPYLIGHAVMQDAIDLGAVMQALAGVGLSVTDTDRLINIFAKAEASPDGVVRGMRHTMLDDSDINSTRHARGAVGGLIAGVAGSSAVYVSGGAEHQGPPGGGPVAAIARV